MDEQVIQDLYNRAVSLGYKKSKEEFINLLHSDASVQTDCFNYAKGKGYKKSMDEFLGLTGAPVATQMTVEKKSPDGTTMVSESEGSSSGFQSQQDIEIPSIEKQIEKITPDFVEKNEEFVVPQMQAQFGDLGFKFEESGATGDWMTVTAPNGKQTEISLDIDWFSPGNSNDEANALKNFIRENAKAIPHIQQLENQYANSKKILTTQEEVDTEIQQMNQESDQFRNDTGVYLNDKTSLDQQLNELNKIKSNTSEYNAKRSELMAKKAELDQRFVDLSKKQEEISRKSDMLKQSVGKYAMMREQQGTWMGATVDWLAEGFANMSAEAVSNVVDLMFSKYTGGVDEEELSKQVTDNIATGNELEDAKDNVALSNAYLLNQSKPGSIPMPAAGQSYKDWWNSLSSDQKTAIVDKSNDQVKKDIKKNLLPAVREGNEIVWGDDDTTVEWRKLSEEGFWGGAYAGLVKSLPAMIGSNNALGWAQRTAQMYLQTTNAIRSEMDKNPEFDNISESEKLTVVAPIGIASAALESIGLRNIIANKGLMNRVILGAMGKAGATTTAKTFGDLVKNEVNSMVAKGALTLAGATLAEAETGAAQQAVEYAVKDIYNLAKEKDMFQTPDFLSAEYIKEIAKAGAQEAVGGFVLGMPSAVGAAYSKKGYLSMNDATFEAFESFANDSKLQSAFIVELKNKVATGLMTPKEAKTMLNDYRNSVGLFRELPDNLDTQGKKEAMNLLKERRDLEQQIDGKEPALVAKQKERIAKINEELTQVSSKPKATISSTVINGNRIQVAPRDRETIIGKLEQEFINSPMVDHYTGVSFDTADGTVTPIRNNERAFAEMLFDALSISDSKRTDNQKQLVSTAEALTDKAKQIATPSRDLNWVNKLKADNIYELFFADEQEVPEELRPKIWSTNTNGQVAVRANGSDVQNAFRVEVANQIDNKEVVSFRFNSLEEVPEPFRDEAREVTFEGRKKVLGLPVGGKVSETKYIVSMTGAEAKYYNVRAPRATTKADVFRNTAKSLASIFPDLQVMNFANANEMKQYAATNLNQQVADSMEGNENGAIIYDASGKPAFIFINDESSDATTLPHEAWHGILLKAFGENPALFKEFRDSIMKTLKKNGFDNIVAELDAFSNDPNYINSNTQAEEWLVQFGGLLTASGLRVDSLTGKGKSLLLDIKEILNKIAVKITGEPIFLEDATPDDILDFMISISETMARGEDLSKFFREGEGAASGAGMRAQMPSNIRLETIDFENESENIDVYDASEKANQIAKDNGVNILRGKDLRSVAVDDNNNVVGGLWTEISGNEFSFDIAIDKEYQRKGIGQELVNEAISEFNAQDFDGNLKYKIDVTNPVMEKLLSNYGFEVVERYDGHAIMEHPTNNPKLKSETKAKFQKTEDGEGMFTTRDGVAIGFNYDTDKVARERFDLKSLTKLGQGSDRVVFDLGDNKVLKVAKTARGLEQNIYEGDGFLNFVPEIYERGLNYVVVDNVPKMKASDMVPTFDENGDQTGEVKASEMIKDLSKFNQRDFDRNSSELWNTISKYGFEDIFSYDVLYGDFKAMRNWGYKDGKAYHTDGGTFGGVKMLTARPSKSLSDAEFREIYNKSKAVKKKFQDTDLYTKFQKNGSDANTIKEVQNIAKRYNINEKGFGPRQASEQALSRELARLGYSAKRSKITPEGYGGGIFIVDGRGKFFNPFKVKFSRINLGAGRLEEGNVNTIPGYDTMLQEANRVAERTANRGASYDRIMEAVMQYVRQSKVYQDANDSQREQLERNVRAEFGKKEKAAPSVAKILGKLADIKRITISEKELLRNHFKDLARGARDAKRAFMEASADLANSINELASSGKISPKQVGAIINRFSKVNMFNEDSVNRFVDYMTKVFNDAEYAEKISGIRTKLTKAKNNIKSKVGIAESVVPSLRQLFAVNPLIVPDDVFDKYVAIVDMFGASDAVLPLADINQVEQDVNEILDALDQEYSQAESFAILFDNYADKVIDEDTGKVKFAETVNKMVKEGNITDDQGELMKKYKSVVFPKEPSEPKSEDEINAEKDVLISNIRSLGVDVDRLPTKDERVLADSLKRLLKPEILKQLSITDLKNLIKLIDNINNGYMPHFGELAVERLNAKTEAINLGEALLEAKPLSITEVYNNLKSKFTKKGGILEMVRSSPFFFIDQTFGNFKTKPIFNALFKQLAESQSAFTSAIGRVNKKLDKAHDAVARSFKYDANKTLESSFRMMAYMIQLEYESNPGNPQVNPASEYIKATIKKIKTGKTMYDDAEIDMLNRILDENGNVDKDALYNSFNKAEREAVKTIREVNDSLTEKAVFTAAVLRGQRIEPLNNYVHLPVMGDYNPDDTATATENSNVYNRSLNSSSKAKNLLERTKGAKPINFDVFASAQRGAKFTLLDYHMTSPIRTARKTLNETLKKYEDEFTNEQRKIFNAVEAGFEEVIGNVLTNNFIVDSFADKLVNFISKQGYRAILASSTRFIAEFTSNIGFAMTKGREAFMNGLKYFKVYTSEYGVDIMDNVLSKNTSRIYHGDTLSGRFIDQSILSQASGVKSVSSKGVVANKANQIYNLSLKKYKNAVELVADTLISTPDKMIMRPVWFGQFASEFKKQSGVEVDFDKIAANDEQYMRTYKEEIAAARDKADEMSILVGATDNPFMGMVKGSVKPNQGPFLRAFNNFNTFMTRFAIYEYTTARQGIYAAMGNGSISRAEGMKLLAAVTVRMTVYTMLTSVLSSTLLGLLGDEDEEDDKTLAQKLGQAVASTGTSLVLGRNFGNATRSLINYGVEYINEEFLDGLRNGDYDPYKDAISFSAIPKEKKMGGTNLSDFITNMAGSFSPAMKTANLIAKKAFEPEKKEKEAIERSEKETSVRIPLEVLGNMGLIPLYKDVRKLVMQDLYKDLRNAEKNAADKKQAEKEMLHGYENKTDMKRYDPELYEKVFGKDSPGYDAEQAKKKLKHEADSLERRMKDEFYDYVPEKKEKSKKGGFGSKGFGSEKMGSKGFGSKGFGSKGFGE